MAKGTPRGGVTTNRTCKLAHSAAVEEGDIIISAQGQVLIAQGNYAQDEEGIYVFAGPAEMPKKAATALAVGECVYFDTDPGEVTPTEADGTRAGFCLEAAAAADTVVLIELMPILPLPTHAHA